MAEIAGIIIACIGGLKGLHSMKSTFEYKKVKKTIYKVIQEGKDSENWEMIVEGAMKLKKFDEINSDILTGIPHKRMLDGFKKCFGFIREPKMNKTLELFGFEKEVITNIEKLTQLHEESLTKASQELKTITEEEQKEQELVSKHKTSLEKIKRRQLAKNNAYRSHIDNFNLTELLATVHKDYEEYIEKHFKVDKDMEERLKREIFKKQLMEKTQIKKQSNMMV